jgi:hypothetical protein
LTPPPRKAYLDSSKFVNGQPPRQWEGDRDRRPDLHVLCAGR